MVRLSTYSLAEAPVSGYTSCSGENPKSRHFRVADDIHRGCREIYVQATGAAE
jgi:hypothetical protein